MQLLDDPELIGEKVEEEAEEVVRAAREESDERVAEEAADLLYHLSVLLASRGVSAGRGDGGAQWPSRLSSELRPRAEPRGGARAGRARATSSRSAPASSTTARRRSRPSSSCAPASPRGRPASCSSPPSRARSAATRSSASARARCCAGATASLTRGRRRQRRARGARPLRRRRRAPGRATGSAPVEGLPPFAGGAVGFFGYDLVRTVEPLGEPNPDPLGLPDMALMITDVAARLRPPAPRADDHGLRLRRRRRRRSTPPTSGPRRRSPTCASACAAPFPRPSARRSPSRRSFDVEHGARGVRSRGRADRRVRPRRRRLPGRALAALLGAGAGRGLLDLPRPARGQPLALHVLPRVRRLPDRRRLAGAAGQGQRATGSRRGRSPAPTRAAPTRRRTAASPSGWSTTPRSGPST